MNATPSEPVRHQNWTNNTWGLNRVLKYTGNREEYFNSSPAGYADTEGLEWVVSGYNSTRELDEEEVKEVKAKAGEMAKLSAHKHLDKAVWMSQKSNQIYPVRDSTSYLKPYF
jgi:hypothetical protein